EKPSTMFIFMVLDDFLQDNLECGTSGMNYYSKLHRLTSNMFPHLVPVSQPSISVISPSDLTMIAYEIRTGTGRCSRRSALFIRISYGKKISIPLLP
ncbi:hypothetical protein EDD15DRAFT_2169328, partial [Pisolithus albus]